jgi:hypothetical protein
MKKILLGLLLLSFSTSLVAQDSPPVQKNKKRGDGAGYSSRDATIFSVMGWGVALGVGIATLCALIGTGDGNNVHSH